MMSKSTRVAWHEALHLDLQIGLQLSSLSDCGQCGLATSPHTGQQVSEKLELSAVGVEHLEKDEMQVTF